MEEHPPSGVEIIRGAFLKKGIAPQSVPTMVNSLSKSTLNQYSTTYKKWWLYCKKHNFDIYSVSVGNVISFLYELFVEKLSYASINTYKSALTLILDISNSDEILIKRFLKGVFRDRPSFPKYTETWDPSIVLQYLKQWYPLENITLEQLTKKLATLLILASGHRINTLSKISIDNISKKSDGVYIYFTDFLKTSSYSRAQPILKLRVFDNHLDLCVVTTLMSYLDRTQSIRDNEKYLFLTHRKPFHRASTQTISRWVKDVMKSSGININKFKSHSTRHASTSAFFRAGLSIDSIKEAAGWSRKSMVFAKFYNRPLQTDTNLLEYLVT